MENIVVLNKVISANSRSTQLIKTLMSHVLPHLYPDEQVGLVI